MGQPISWQYTLVWSAQAKDPKITLYRQSNIGHRFVWVEVGGNEHKGIPSVDEVLQELYTGLLAMMEATA